MNPELLRTVYFALETVYPPVMQMEKNQLTELYGTVNQRYHYSSFALIPNGAVFLGTRYFSMSGASRPNPF